MIGRGDVARGQRPEPAPRLDLRPGAGDVQQAIELDVVRDRVEQAVDGLDADDIEHLANVLACVGDVAMRTGGSSGIREGHKN